ncbi:hypothetical protein SDC9_127496 [bioreactor metagenome]|uniref:Uncharacterized protein n=1 Tax=bioreactor metagenome TaxID=1076179 RepID=A0A645CU72_9ZZZZ
MADDHHRNRQRTDVTQPVAADRSGGGDHQQRIAVVHREETEKFAAAVQHPAAEEEFTGLFGVILPVQFKLLERFARPFRGNQPVVQQPLRGEVPGEVTVAGTPDHHLFRNQLRHHLFDRPLTGVETGHQLADRIKAGVRRQALHLAFQFQRNIVFPVFHWRHSRVGSE